MRSVKTIMIVALAVLGLFMIPSFASRPSSPSVPTMASYNPAPANKFHSPLSAMAMLGIAGTSWTNRTGLKTAIASDSLASSSQGQGNSQSIRTNAIRFINDNSDFPQSETTIAVDPNNPNNIVMGFNDGRYFLCPVLVAECAGPQISSLTGFSLSTDGGKTVAKTGNFPALLVNDSRFVPNGDPSLTPTMDGNFFFSSLLFNAFSPFLGNAIIIAKSNANLLDPKVLCATDPNNIYVNACWNIRIVYGNFGFVLGLEDKDRISVDRDPASPFFGSAYVSWDHFKFDGTSDSFVARCDSNLTGCVMLSGGTQPVISTPDRFVGWTTPTVDKNGNVFVAWCNFGTILTLGPVDCRISSSPPGGQSFGPPVEIISYMGPGTMLPSATPIIGWATEQFRTASGIISIASDLSPKTNNLYFTTQLCTFGHFYQFPSFIGVAPDNPGLCGDSTVVLSKSADGGATWSSPVGVSKPAVNDQAYVTVDSLTGQVFIVYYTTQFDKFNHRIDVVASTSNNGGQTFHQFRVTSVSNEPDSDPNMFNYIIPSGFGGSFLVPQFGDYFEATSVSGTLYVSFTANYSAEQGTLQTDPFLAIAGQGNQQ